MILISILFFSNFESFILEIHENFNFIWILKVIVFAEFKTLHGTGKLHVCLIHEVTDLMYSILIFHLINRCDGFVFLAASISAFILAKKINNIWVFVFDRTFLNIEHQM